MYTVPAHRERNVRYESEEGGFLPLLTKNSLY